VGTGWMAARRWVLIPMCTEARRADSVRRILRDCENRPAQRYRSTIFQYESFTTTFPSLTV
jgi:hypothetical protein